MPAPITYLRHRLRPLPPILAPTGPVPVALSVQAVGECNRVTVDLFLPAFSGFQTHGARLMPAPITYLRHRLGALALSLALTVSVPAHANVQEGLEAFQRGDYAVALALLRPAAE